MNKLIHSAAAAALVCFATASFAQAECQAGSAWGSKPGCDNTSAPPPAPIAGNSGWSPPGWVYDQNQIYYPGAVPQAFPQQVYPQQVYPLNQAGTQVWVDPATGAQYAVRPRASDRDGDGVRNSRDRYPDDPRYR